MVTINPIIHQTTHICYRPLTLLWQYIVVIVRDVFFVFVAVAVVEFFVVVAVFVVVDFVVIVVVFLYQRLDDSLISRRLVNSIHTLSSFRDRIPGLSPNFVG